jgi:dTDP-4-dehydrorhamnose reductase
MANVQVVPVTSAQYPAAKAKRPFNSRLEKSKLIQNGFQPLPVWQDALTRYLKELGE